MMIQGRYQLGEKLGEGGMGTVFLSEDTQTNQPVAIKQLKPELLNADMLERFQREGQALRDLNHPNIVKMLDSLEENGSHYLIMEYVAGGDLRQLIETGELPIQQILQIAIDLADALTRAHRLDIIHRDLKPANVLIAEDGTPRLTDFGVAHMADKEQITGTNAIVGTIDYLAPETFQGGSVDNKTDIWAFGVLLFEMLTGQRPFAGKTTTHTIYQIVSEETPDLEELRPEIPVALADLVYRMLEKEPKQRVPSVRHVGTELEDILQGRSTNTPPESRFETPLPDIFVRAKHNLPSQVTEFVGREAELAELAKLLDDPKLRLITILAPGGMGKTRLSLEVAKRYVERPSPTHSYNNFEDGVYFVELAPLREVGSIVLAIADAIAYPLENSIKSPKDDLFSFLSNKSMLLVMDNFEHLLDGASIVTEILNAAPDVQILATSRKRLEQAGETLFHLSGMEFPEWETPEDAMDYAAVKLFMQGAKRARPDFELTGDNLDYVARICRLAAGMPLGIVLAAAWLGLLSIEEVAEELQQSIDFLEAEGSDVPNRQRSIRVVFDYSWQMMSDDEQTVFMQLSVFRGGFTRQAAQEITGANLRTLMALVNKSLIRRDADSGRYEIHELLRQYAAEQLESKSALFEESQGKHAQYYLQFVAERTDWLKGGKQKQSADEIDSDFENVKEAWIYAAEQEWFEILEQSYQAVSIFSSKFKVEEDVEILWDAVLQNCVIDENTPLVGLHAYIHRTETVEKLLELLPIVEARQNHSLLRHAYNRIRYLLYSARDYEASFTFTQKTLESALKENDPYYLGFAYYGITFLGGGGDINLMFDTLLISHNIFVNNHNLLGNITSVAAMATLTSLIKGNYLQGYDYARESIDIALQFKRIANLPYSFSVMAVHSLFTGKDLEESKVWLDKAIAIQQIFGNMDSIAAIEMAKAHIFCMEERYDEAGINADLSIKHSSNLFFHSNANIVLSIVAAATRDAEIVDRVKKAVAVINITIKGTNAAIFSFYLPAIAKHYLNQGRFNDAAEVCSIAFNHPKAPKKFFEILPLMQDLIAALKEALSKDEFEAAWERGKQIEFSAVVERFLEEVE